MSSALRTSLGSVCVLLTVMSLALLPLIFSTSWYQFNCHFHDRCSNLDPVGVQAYAHTMGQFFLYRSELVGWDTRGAAHLADVRTLYSQLAVAAVAAAGVLAALLWRRPANLSPFARGALVLLLLCSLVMPVFGTFWEKVFHPLLFDNDLWRTRRGEILWSLTPRVFFRNTVALLLTLSAVGCAALWWIGSRRR